MLIRLILLLIVLVACVTPTGVAAQTIQGRVTEEGSGSPVAAAFVVLFDEAGQQRGAALTDSSGIYQLRGRGGGSYTLRVERMGHRSTVTEAIRVALGQTVRHDIVVPLEPIRIMAIEAGGAPRCELTGDAEGATSLLWEEARKALAITAWLESEAGVPYQVQLFEQDRDLITLEVADRTTTLRSGFGRQAFTSASPEDLAAHGFVRLIENDFREYYGLDAATLLSEPFLDTHCFRIRRPGRTDPAHLVGLAFEPVAGRDLPDIRGTLWIERDSLRLSHLEFEFTNLLQPIPLPREAFGGRTEFRRLANGAWVVSRWSLRMPQSSGNVVTRRELARLSSARNARARLLAAHQIGLRIREAGGILQFIAEPARPVAGPASLRGVVVDEIRNAALAHALVVIPGTGRTSRTDRAGGFRIDALPAGGHSIAVLHPAMDSLGMSVTAVPLQLSIGMNEVRLGVARETACRVQTDAPTGVVVGVVYDAYSGEPVADAEVTIAWGGVLGVGATSVSATTGRDGHYQLCGVPRAGDARLVAQQGGGRMEDRLDLSRLLADSRWGRKDVRLP